MSTVDGMAGVPGFGDIPQSALSNRAEIARRREFQAGELLFEQGEPATRLYLILEGSVMLERRHAHLVTPVEVGERGGGDVVGSEGVLEGAPRPWSARAVTRTATLEITLKDGGRIVH